MIDLCKRSYKKEILDGSNIPFADIRQNMQELNTINKHLGGHTITIAGVKKILNKNRNNTSITICELGSGGGDNLQAINKWCIKNNITANFIGIEIKAECIAFASQQYPLLNCRWILSDYEQIAFDNDKPTIIFSSLFCHHFTDVQLVIMLQWMKQNSAKGFFINDLHRHWLAYYFIQVITRLFSHSYLVINDAPLSVARGFVFAEWKKIIAGAGIKNYSINWKWAFRHLIIYNNE